MQTILIEIEDDILTAVNELAEKCETDPNNVIQAFLIYGSKFMKDDNDELLRFVGLVKTIEMNKRRKK